MKLTELYDTPNQSGWLYLSEAPQQIGDVDWNLSDPVENAKHRDELLTNRPKQIGVYFGLNLYRNRGQIFALDPQDDNEMVYWVKTDVRKINMIGTTAICQRALWRNSSNARTNGLAKRIFFDVWLKDYDTVVTDGMQTAGGKSFWFNRVENAFDAGLNVYYVNELSPRQVKKFQSLQEFQDFALDNIWGKTPEYKHRLVVITSKVLTEK